MDIGEHVIGLGKCSICGQQKKIIHSYFSKPHLQVKYCQGCYDYSYAKIKCDKCEMEIKTKDRVKHMSDMHSD